MCGRGYAQHSPNLDPVNWKDMRPTNKMAPFDIYTSTQATSTSDITYTINARFCKELALFGLVGSNYTVVVKEYTGGATLETRTGTLREHPSGWWGYLFGTRFEVRQLILEDLPMRPNAEITVTISAGGVNPRALGMLVLGNKKSLTGVGDFGGTRLGATVDPVTYSFIKTDEDGSTTIVRRHKATNLRAEVVLPRDQVDLVVQTLQQVLDTPVAVFASGRAGRSLSTFGLIQTSPVAYDSISTATINLDVKGII